MSFLSADTRAWLLALARTDAFQQLFPLVVVVGFPLLFLAFPWRALSNYIAMVFEGLMPWNWGTGSAAGAGERRVRRRRKGKGTRRGSAASETGTSETGACWNGRSLLEADGAVDTDSPLDGYYPGLVNISGTYCYMNSTLQVRSAAHPPVRSLLTLRRRSRLSPTCALISTSLVPRQRRSMSQRQWWMRFASC